MSSHMFATCFHPRFGTRTLELDLGSCVGWDARTKLLVPQYHGNGFVKGDCKWCVYDGQVFLRASERRLECWCSTGITAHRPGQYPFPRYAIQSGGRKPPAL
ncbi:hypothetical protein BDV28DRAFT_139893 [Aspergillus coremiiformis]|uniref:Cyanovirin-N domain-containing protein n=1 Tax=Aspergillus coremiiformis TaxID=138285 RepID=A0A5N6YZD8_9EURO|nr:hypothetical protein BDV28DRAFT_139893 [Aspergillus coremiiformis]